MKYDIMMSTTDLNFGINRPQSWWNEHHEHRHIYEGIRESIKNEGLQKPLEIYNGIFDGQSGIFVEIGNQRLKALLELGIPEAPCVWLK